MFGNNLKVLRKEKGFSQEELATRLHVVRQTISKWEKGLSVPDADLLVRLSEILDTPVETLLGATVGKAPATSVIAQQLEQITATLAEKNRRSRFIWRVVGIALLVVVVVSILLAVAGVITFQNFMADGVATVEEITNVSSICMLHANILQ